MKALLHRLAVLALSVTFGCSGSGDTAQRPPATDPLSTELNVAKTITILHVNDSHSVLDSIGPNVPTSETSVAGTLGGLTKAATVIKGIRDTTENTLFLHAGDVFEGDLTFVRTQGVVELQELKKLGLDALTLGNHEFDYGPGLLASVLNAPGFAHVPVLSANLVPDPEQPHPLSSRVTGHVVKTVAGVRIGIFGLTTPTDPLAITAPFTLADDVISIAKAEVAALRAAKADVIILLSHLESELNEAIAQPNIGIDFIIAGHDEYLQTFENYERGKTSTIQAGNFYRYVGRLDLVLRNGQLDDATHTLIPVNESVSRFPSVSAQVRHAQAEVNAAFFTSPKFPAGFDAFHTPVAEADELGNLWTADMGPRRDLAVGSLAADALKAKFPDAQLGATTSGFLNDKVYKGLVTANDLFRALPYGINPALFVPGTPDAVLPDPVLMATISGLQLYAGLEVALAYNEIPQVSDGTFMCFDLDAPAYSRMKLVVIDGVPITPETPEVSVATNVVVWQILNAASVGAGLGEITLPDLDPENVVTQFSALLEYAQGRFDPDKLVPPAQPRVLNMPGNGCYEL